VLATPLVGAEITFGFSPVCGELICVMRMPDEMIGPRAMPATLEAFNLAVKRGVRVIGLGALTSPATGAGLRLLQHAPPGVTITNGNAYTAEVVRLNVVEASELLGLGSQARVAVIGCTGSVGVPASQLLAEEGFRLTLIGRNVQRVRQHLGCLTGRAAISDDIAAAKAADVTVLLTSDPSARLSPDHVRPDSIVIDFAQPPNVVDRDAFSQRGIDVVHGGLVQIPEYSCALDLGTPSRVDTFACLAETYLFARDGIREHSVGRPSIELARKLARAAKRHGIVPSPLNISSREPRPLSMSSGEVLSV
jgi:predicted amino acid dehydrogenase